MSTLDEIAPIQPREHQTLGKQVTPAACLSRASPRHGQALRAEAAAVRRQRPSTPPCLIHTTAAPHRKLRARLRTDTRGWACSHARAASSSASRDVPTCSGCRPLRPDPGREGIVLQADCPAQRPVIILDVAARSLTPQASELVHEVHAGSYHQVQSMPLSACVERDTCKSCSCTVLRIHGKRECCSIYPKNPQKRVLSNLTYPVH